MNVYVLEQCVTEVPPHDEWLSAREVECLNRMRFEKRRTDWRLGRWTAKFALACYFHLSVDDECLAEIEIRPEPSGAPVVFLAGKASDISVSLSHRAGRAICAVGESGAALGCDLEIIEERSDAFVADYFTAEEQKFVAHSKPEDRSKLLALFWSAKESVLKAQRIGLRQDTRCLAVDLVRSELREPDRDFVSLTKWSREWHPLQVNLGEQAFAGWWQCTRTRMITVIGAPSPCIPISLGFESHRPHQFI